MRQIDNMSQPERETLELKGMLGRRPTVAAPDTVKVTVEISRKDYDDMVETLDRVPPTGKPLVGVIGYEAPRPDVLGSCKAALAALSQPVQEKHDRSLESEARAAHILRGDCSAARTYLEAAIRAHEPAEQPPDGTDES